MRKKKQFTNEEYNQFYNDRKERNEAAFIILAEKYNLDIISNTSPFIIFSYNDTHVYFSKNMDTIRFKGTTEWLPLSDVFTEEAKVFQWGKYKGIAYSEILVSDRKYFEWAMGAASPDIADIMLLVLLDNDLLKCWKGG